MALTTNNQNNAGGISNYASGEVVTDSGTAVNTSFAIGFTPRYILWLNQTNRVRLEWFEGMAANTAIRTVAAGTVTLDTSSGITVSSDNDLGQPVSFTINAADIPASCVFSYIAEA